MNHGLNARQLGILKNTLAPFYSKITQVGLFGSRAINNFRENSDIDLVLYGTLTTQEINRIYSLFKESSLPVFVDVVSYENIKHKALKTKIDAEMQVLNL